jgi:5-formyltetrahydrofolate cyclo-ligase
LEQAKAELRRRIRDLRKAIDPAKRAEASGAAAARLAASGKLDGQIVSGFWPVGSEIDVRAAMLHAIAQGGRAALPVIVARARPLVFREWAPGRPMIGLGRLYEPPAAAEMLTPTVLLAPLLAFDRRGGRLGQGGGFYDRTLAQLRAKGHVLAIGVAFAAQEVQNAPVDARDAPLDAVVTEEEWISCG